MESRLIHTYRKQGSNKKKHTVTGNTLIKKVLFFLFLILLLRYSQYGPGSHSEHTTFLSQIFVWYTFIVNQTLGMIHESGHGICYVLPCSQFLTVLNATVFQIGFPLGVAYYYRRRNNPFASAVAFYITGISAYYTSWYISTVNEGKLVPASKSFLGVDGYHDFYYLLEQIGMLAYYQEISLLVKAVAYGMMFYGLWQMFLDAFKSPGR